MDSLPLDPPLWRVVGEASNWTWSRSSESWGREEEERGSRRQTGCREWLVDGMSSTCPSYAWWEIYLGWFFSPLIRHNRGEVTNNWCWDTGVVDAVELSPMLGTTKGFPLRATSFGKSKKIIQKCRCTLPSFTSNRINPHFTCWPNACPWVKILLEGVVIWVYPYQITCKSF